MSGAVKKALAIMVAALIVIIGIIIFLASRDKVVKEPEELGETVIAEKATEIPTEPEEIPEQTAEPEQVNIPNEKEMSLYVDYGGVMEKVEEFRSAWTPYADIATFEAFNSKEQEIPYYDYFSIHEEIWNSTEATKNYWIGYEISFTVNGEEKVYTILQPKDIDENPDLHMGDYPVDEYGTLVEEWIPGYLGVWVYNDIGHDGTYVHLTQEEMTTSTLLTSIKLRPTPQSDQISNLKLKVFSYSSKDEFNSAGRYIGTHGYEIPVINEG